MSTSARRRLMRDFKVCSLEIALLYGVLFFFPLRCCQYELIGPLTLLHITSVCKLILQRGSLHLL